MSICLFFIAHQRLKKKTALVHITTVIGDHRENKVGNAHALQPVVGKPEVKKPFGRPVLRWEDNIKMDFKKWMRACGLD